ncbi:NAD(P)-dependent oxidoreductase [Falsochrobactrum ovis]|uniref:dihydrouracil dehydrogenase (NAD(+)) n=1 Tax=Falsochrobactrum ovis TaxID=1293442 RepID=A0A364JZR4_9HYPH|nr:NAD(P)-dependent oxidoreductase [Falsochrobactrum ovis]RAK34140.1 NADPH-dependent glutamate synthase beta subunit-like oxidoreductase [Falsochrobactrum ovis]
MNPSQRGSAANSSINAAGPDIRSARLTEDAYAHVFDDLHPPLSQHEALVESDRCYFCYDAPCMQACPTSIDIPLFIRQINAGNPVGAAKTILNENILGGMCARVCPTETLCEEVCVREVAEGKPVKIGYLQRYATDVLMAQGLHPFKRAPETGKHIAIVGAGPAGISAAHRLSTYGHQVTIFEARPKGGGLNEYGIAAYKTVDNFAQRELDFVLKIGGIQIEYNQILGQNITLDALQANYDAVFLAMGLPGVNDLNLVGEDAPNVLDAVDYIANLRQAKDLSMLPVGRNVVVIGGGMTAIDIAIQTKKLGAENVTIVYRRGQESMNASAYEQELAQIHGVTIRHWLQPHSLERNDDGTVHSIVFEYTDTIEGRLRGTGEYLVLEADQVFKAIGQNFIQEPLLSAGIALSKGRISVDDERRTSVEGIWAGGDCVAGGQDLTVASVEDGKIAAESIHASLMKQPEAAEGVAEAILAGGVHHTISPNKPATSGSWLSGKQG